MHPLPELARRLENILRFGIVTSVDHAATRCVVTAGALVTRPLPWITQRAGGARTWWAPSVGESVMLLCPGGDPARGIVLCGLYTDSAARPEGADTAHVVVYTDGAVIGYDPEAHQLSANLPGGGKAAIVATGGIHLTGDVTITGKLSVSGAADLQSTLHVASDVTVDTTVTASDDVIGGGKRLATHKHTGVQSGGSVSGPPQ